MTHQRMSNLALTKQTHTQETRVKLCLPGRQRELPLDPTAGVSHPLPSGDIAPGRFLSPEEAQRRVAAPAGWLCLGARTTRRERVCESQQLQRGSGGGWGARPTLTNSVPKSHLWRLKSSRPSRPHRTPGSCSPAGCGRSSACRGESDTDVSGKLWLQHKNPFPLRANLLQLLLTPAPVHRWKGCKPGAGSVSTEIYAGL